MEILNLIFFYFVYSSVIILKSFFIIFPLLISVAFLTGLERKGMASMQQRKGPNVVGFFGMLQPFADGLKLCFKETILPSSSNVIIFVFSPVITFFTSLIIWVSIPFFDNVIFVNLNLGVLYVFSISSFGIYGIIMSGWSSNNKWSFLGSLRSAAQMISYEVSIGIILLCVILSSGSLNLIEIIDAQRKIYFFFPLFPLFVMFFISGLAETNRAPFDLPEAEAELVSGYSTEYSSMGFALFFLGEYLNMILICSLTAIYFFGGWLSPFDFLIFKIFPFWFGLKVSFLLFFFIWIRSSFPRFRYDQLMRLCWKIFLPFSLAWFIFISGLLFGFDLLSK